MRVNYTDMFLCCTEACACESLVIGRIALLAVLAGVTLSLASSGTAIAASPPPVVCHLRLDNEPITPVTVHLLKRASRQADESRAVCLVLELDTPGGLLDSTQRIVKVILASRVPVVVYVSPSGARAASAGMFITLAGHVSAMAPGTRIGAAHPVEIGGAPARPSTPAPDERESENNGAPVSPMAEKLVSDTKAWARGLAKLRGHDVEWVERAVEKSEAITAAEAVESNVVDLIAADLASLLEQIDGRKVTLRTGMKDEQSVELDTENAQVVAVEMWWGERLLAVISNPNVALLLMMLGVYGILYEFFSPGWGIAGTLGVICLVLAFFGLSLLPINYAGLALILVALALFAAEPFFVSHGALTIGGIACLILGGTMLVDSPTGFLRVSMAVLIPVAVGTGLVVAFLVGCIVRTYRRRVQTGDEGMAGALAEAKLEFHPADGCYAGQVFLRGEWWNAQSPSPVAAGELVQVDGREGLTLMVRQNIDRETTVDETNQNQTTTR